MGLDLWYDKIGKKGRGEFDKNTNAPCVNTPLEKKKSAESFGIKGFSGLNTAS